MTISTTELRESYVGNGVTVVFSFPYRFLTNSDLVVTLIESTGDQILQVLDTDYTVSGEGDESGGSVTMTIAPGATETLLITRDLEITQEIDYISGDAFPAETHELALDRLTMIAQQISYDTERSIKVGIIDSTDVGTELPSPESNKYLRWNATENALENAIGTGIEATGMPAYTLTELRAALTYPGAVAYLKEDGRAGEFLWDSSNLSTEVTADTQSGIYVAPASDLTGASGAWVREYSGAVSLSWYGGNIHAAILAIGATETTLVIDTDATLTKDDTVPSTLTLEFLRGNTIITGGWLLTNGGSVGAGASATSIAAMEAYSAPVGYVFSLNAGGRSGTFDVIAGDFSSELTADTENGIYVGLADDPTATTKVAKRRGNDTDVSFVFFGELGSGDDALLLQSAFDFIEFKGGGTVRAEVEEINWQTQVKIPSNTHFLVGEKTVITRGAAINNMLVNNSDGSIGGYSANSGMTVTGGIWDVNKSNFSSQCTAIAFGHSSNVEIRNSTFKNTPQWHCIEYNGVLRGKVINCNFSDCDLLDNAEAIQIDLMQSSAQFPWFGPYDGSPCYKISVTGCTFSSVGSGIGSHSADATKKHIGILIESNFFKDIEYTAVKCLNYSGVKVLNNRIEDARYGITVATVSGSVNSDYLVIGNTLYNIKKDAVASRGIAIDGDNSTDRRIRDVVVSNNFVKETGNHGIGLDFLLHCTVSGNISQRSRRTGIWIYGCSEFTVTGNQARDNDVGGLGESDIVIGHTGAQNTIRGVAVGNRADKIKATYTSEVLVRQNNATSSFFTSNNASGSFNENLVAGNLN